MPTKVRGWLCFFVVLLLAGCTLGGEGLGIKGDFKDSVAPNIRSIGVMRGVCGDGNCAGDETVFSCPQDCSTDSNFHSVCIQDTNGLTEVVSIYSTSGTFSQEGSLATDASGNDHIVWADTTFFNGFNHSGIYYRKRAANSIWNEQELVSDRNVDAVRAALFAEPDGTVHVVWSSYGNSNESLVFYRKRSPQGIWGVSELVGTRVNIGPTATEPDIARSPLDGSLHVVWDTGGEVRYARKNLGGGWSATETIARHPPWGVDNDPVIAIGSDGEIHVVWVANSNQGGRDILHKSKASNASWDWNEELVSVGTETTFSFEPSLVIGPDGVLYVAWIEGNPLRPMYNRKARGANWETSTSLPLPPSTFANRNPAIALDNSGKPRVSWTSNTDFGTIPPRRNHIVYSRLEETGWTVPMRISTESDWTSGFSAMIIDNQNRPTFVWRDTSNYDGAANDGGAGDIFYKKVGGIVPRCIQVPGPGSNACQTNLDCADSNLECGNRILDSGEECELGISCSNNQLCDLVSCQCISTFCGNNQIERPNSSGFVEVCDGTALDGKSCETLGFDGGSLRCQSDCSGFDTENCANILGACGDNIANRGEQCGEPGIHCLSGQQCNINSCLCEASTDTNCSPTRVGLFQRKSWAPLVFPNDSNVSIHAFKTPNIANGDIVLTNNQKILF